jgi:hypothetical protein
MTASPVDQELYQQLIGERLSGVTFVLDYLQLQFDPPPTLNVYTSVTVVSGGRSARQGDDQFRNLLCDQIPKVVRSVVVERDSEFRITFEDGSAISISLRSEDYRGAEAIYFQGRENQWNVI